MKNTMIAVFLAAVMLFSANSGAFAEGKCCLEKACQCLEQECCQDRECSCLGNCCSETKCSCLKDCSCNN